MFSHAHWALMVQLKEALSRTNPCRTNLANKVQKKPPGCSSFWVWGLAQVNIHTAEGQKHLWLLTSLIPLFIARCTENSESDKERGEDEVSHAGEKAKEAKLQEC